LLDFSTKALHKRLQIRSGCYNLISPSSIKIPRKWDRILSVFIALNGTSVIDFKEHSKKEDVCAFLRSIRSANPDHEIVIVLDNFRSHKAKETIACAIECDVQLAFLPPYSPDLNPIEFIWKSIQRDVSSSFIRDLNHMRDPIQESFMTCSSRITYAKRWIEVFLKDRNISLKS
jgi:transposase